MFRSIARVLSFLLIISSSLGSLTCAETEESESGGYGPVSDEWQAESIANMINTSCSEVRAGLPAVFESDYSYTFTNYPVSSSRGGSCLVTGSVVRDFYASASLVRDESTLNITIIFDNWQMYDNNDSSITGTVEYHCYSYSSTGSSYYSTLGKTIEGDNLTVHHVTEAVNDTVGIDVDDDDNNDFMVTGTITGTEGTFSF